MSEYQSELGQAAFGQPYKEFEVPDIWEAALWFLRKELGRVKWNMGQREYPTPFANTGGVFTCPVFEVHAYSWDDDVEQPYNFKWRDVEISWYKYLGRGMSANKELSPDLAATMLSECIDYLREIDKRSYV